MEKHLLRECFDIQSASSFYGLFCGPQSLFGIVHVILIVEPHIFREHVEPILLELL